MEANPVRHVIEMAKGTKDDIHFAVSEVNDHCVRAAVLEGECQWRFHPDSEKLIIVLEGELLVDVMDHRTEVLQRNDSFLIPRGAIYRFRSNQQTVCLSVAKTASEAVGFEKDNVLKLIRCKPAGRNRQPFSEAQAKWKPISNIKGFVRQWGGWLEAEEEPEAVIMALWKTKQDYMNFMKNDHDLIYETTNQKDTFHSSHIELIEDPAEIGRALKRHSPALVPEWTVACRA
ncbi:DUF4937 domain-containing protein [Bacillus sonorensis]|uniref:DUF4937 domain-containing protein n=1 Tax=Bacillus sonorensis TaxID=119858 RepID=UPI002282623E|nr:DUF4937 domain-containing protein [Bacillus sonorensis]MCY8035350.1 DUF4937 domain-containing protein [Bacillus sonorensis]MCY8087726.1 DUF4937 domain-containing protein [Bacillus sonorensis]MCY8404226.1 DUF4937 domain-containing protein [Bacillus sonorensis]MCY8562884.1 DUF4937 domain-containing protein [Bacillus sonorensis]MEC1503624.1 DUF4937 domain-containing protein [Bacillus sonorensis]